MADGDHVRCMAGQHISVLLLTGYETIYDLRFLKLLYCDINVVKLCHFLNSPDWSTCSDTVHTHLVIIFAILMISYLKNGTNSHHY